MRWLWGAAGLAALLLGLAFLAVPVIPTSPFLVLAAACWMRASPRLERWLVEHRWFGGPIRAWRAGRGVSWRVKMLLVTLAALGMGLALWRLPQGSPWLGAGVVAGGVLSAWFFLSLPTRPD